MNLLVSPARTTGTTPLGVLFDATASTSVLVTSRPFHDIQYDWDFGDAGSGTWGYGADTTASRNHDTGPVAAHIYETAGAQTWVCNAWDGANLGFATGTITPTSADADYPTTSTVCISTSGNFTGAPAGSTHVTSSDFDAAYVANAGSGKRLLFCRGETFSASVAVGVTFDNSMVAAYGSGAKPIAQMSGNDNFFVLSNQSTPGRHDFRLVDIQFNGLSKSACRVIEIDGGFDEVTLLRVDMNDIAYGAHFSGDILDFYNTDGNPAHSGHHVFDNLFVQDCTIINLISGAGSNGAYVFSTNFAWMGNHVDQNAGAEHGLRMPYGSKFVISHNTHEDQAIGKHVLTIRGPTWTGNSIVAANNYTEMGVVAGNKWAGIRGDYCTTIEPQNAASDERIRKVIVERNWFKGGLVGADGTQLLMKCEASDVTIRNNLFDTSGGKAHIGVQVMYVSAVGNPGPDNVRILNNTFYSSDTDGDFAAVIIDPEATNTTVKNNLAYAPNDTLHALLQGTGASGLSASNNSSTAQVGATNPNFASATPTVPADFKIQTGSYAKAGGVSLAQVYDDFSENWRTGTMDMGAFAYDETGSPPWESAPAASPPSSVVPRSSMRTWHHGR